MKIVVLDGFALNPGDLDWRPLERLGTQCEIHDRTPVGQVVERARDAEVILTNKCPVTREHLARLDRLRYIGVLATGYNNVDVQAARERGVPVSNIPEYGAQSVAQTTLALLLELAHRVGHHSETARAGRWAASADFCYWDYPLIELAGRSIGIVGWGRIGQTVSRLAAAFGMESIVWTRRMPATFPSHAQGADSLEDLLERSDVTSLHCPLTEETREMINESRLEKMKPASFLINTSRGPLIDEPALARALNSGRLAGAALDVLSQEPPSPDNPLLTARNCLITPHIAWATSAARRRLLDRAIENLEAFIAGRPMNVVN